MKNGDRQLCPRTTGFDVPSRCPARKGCGGTLNTSQ